MEPGINKPFDRIAKDFAEEAPMVILRLLGIAPPGARVNLEVLRTETAPSVVMPDYVALLQIDDAAPCIFHVEFFLRYLQEIPGSMARYGGSLALQYDKPVRSIMLLMDSTGCPDELPTEGVIEIGGTRIVHPYRTERFWELDPEPVLSADDPGLLPWALLMRLGREEAYRLGAKVAKTGKENWIARFLTLGGLRYHRKEVEQMLGGRKMGLAEVIIEGSHIYREYREEFEKRTIAKIEEQVGRRFEQDFAQRNAQVKAEGKAEGEAEGKADEARRLLKLALGRRFPGLESSPELDRISDVATLESLLVDHAIVTNDPEAMADALRKAASANG